MSLTISLDWGTHLLCLLNSRKVCETKKKKIKRGSGGEKAAEHQTLSRERRDICAGGYE